MTDAVFTPRPYDRATAQRLTAGGLPAPLARALAARGVVSLRDLELIAGDLLKPAALTGAGHAARLLADALAANQRLLIVADYDCDGATACAVGVRGLRALAAAVGSATTVDYLVPNRFETGYGLTPEIVAIAAARTPRPDWLITVDNGIASVDGVAHANALGMQVLITDHHLPGSELPAARAIVNPNVAGCGFPSKNLAGVGVMFYVLLALRAELRERGHFNTAEQPRLDALLDLVALGTVADVVRLDRNNRILVAEGIKRIRAGRMQPGLAALFQLAGRHARTAQPADLGFAVGPRINAAGRLADMAVGIECLLTDDFEHALELARQLDALNRDRRARQTDMQLDALAALAAAPPAAARTITLFDPDWHQGIVGLIAARIKEAYHRPTIAFARTEAGPLRGSGRSIDGVHLRDAIDLATKLAPGTVERFGGHAMAAGLTLRADSLAAFARAFEDATARTCEAALFERRVATDGPLSVDELTPALAEAIEREVWGQGFPPPLFDNRFAVLEQRLLKDAHLKLLLELDGRRFDAIWFRRGEPLGGHARLAYRPRVETWQGQRRLTLYVEHAESAHAL